MRVGWVSTMIAPEVGDSVRHEQGYHLHANLNCFYQTVQDLHRLNALSLTRSHSVGQAN